MMRGHECRDLTTKIHYQNKKHENGDHKYTTMLFCPFGKTRMIGLEIFGLKPRKSCHDKYKYQSEYRRLRDSEYDRFCDLRESFFEHFESGEEYHKESYPLDWRILYELLRYVIWSDYHQYDRYDESDHEIYYIPMTRSCYSKDIVETHSDIGNDDSLDGSLEGGCSLSSSMFGVLTRTYLTIELPYYIEEKYRPEEFESRDLEEKYDAQWEYDTEYRRTCDSPEYCLFLEFGREIFRRHTDEYSIISAHDEIDEDDIEEGECTCGGEKMKKVRREGVKHKEKLMWNYSIEIKEIAMIFDSEREKW